METFEAKSVMPASADEVFALHERDGALARLTPPTERVEIVERRGTIRDGDRSVLRMRVGPLSLRWVAEHRAYLAGRQFVDAQVEGPFTSWEHLHRVEPIDGDHCEMIDRIEYRLPLGALGRTVARRAMEARLTAGFRYRHAVLAHDVLLHHRARRPLKIAISGASGFLGRHLRALLTSGGHTVVPIVRGKASDAIPWNPERGTIDSYALEGFDAVIHLAGEPVAQRWTPAAMRRIRESRVRGTALLANTLAWLDRPPAVFVSMSAIGYYGARTFGVDERSSRGDGFLAEVCEAWEAAAKPARDAGIRVVHPRMGVVLGGGGMLSKMKPAFQLGVGGRVGSGEQPISWVGLDDAIGALYFSVLDERLQGPVNVTAPRPVTNREFTEILARVLRRPAVLPIPAFAAEAALGQMAREVLLQGAPVQPRALTQFGYPFLHEELEPALRHVLGKPAPWSRAAPVHPTIQVSGQPNSL